MKSQALKHILLITVIVILWTNLLGDAARAQTLFPDALTSNPADGTKEVAREEGRDGLLFRFKFFNAGGLEDDAAGFPPSLATSPTTTLTACAGPSLTCSLGVSLTSGACSYQVQVVAGQDDSKYALGHRSLRRLIHHACLFNSDRLGSSDYFRAKR